MRRRTFLAGLAAVPLAWKKAPLKAAAGPVYAATWGWGLTALAHAKGPTPLDRIVAGINAVELDPEVMTVGVGGYPDASGVVTLDAMVMDGDTLDCGAVAALQDIPRAISVARDVMLHTRHVLLAGEGARQFAIRRGHEVESLHTDASRAAYREWLAEKGSERPFWELHEADHDTVGMVGVEGGTCAVGLSTSGLRWKLPGRVGDSPLVGSGGYADSEVGAVAGTGIGGHISRMAGAHSGVEGMRRGLEPREAAVEVLERLLRRRDLPPKAQVAFVAVRADGAVGGACTKQGFVMAIGRGEEPPALYEVPATR